MAETNERTVQDIFDDERNNYTRIEELQEEINNIKQLENELKECKKKKRFWKKNEKLLKLIY